MIQSMHSIPTQPCALPRGVCSARQQPEGAQAAALGPQQRSHVPQHLGCGEVGGEQVTLAGLEFRVHGVSQHERMSVCACVCMCVWSEGLQ